MYIISNLLRIIIYCDCTIQYNRYAISIKYYIVLYCIVLY